MLRAWWEKAAIGPSRFLFPNFGHFLLKSSRFFIPLPAVLFLHKQEID